MDIKEGVELKNYTTFHIGGPAKHFIEVDNANGLSEAINFADNQSLSTFVIGGGSNILMSDKGFKGLVIRVIPRGKEVINETDTGVLVKIAAGEVWDQVVAWAVENDWWGIENLSHIPGLSGALAVQNVGAYGQQASDVVEKVEVFDTVDKSIKIFTNSDCKFSYRSSIFNSTERGHYIILSVTLNLRKTGQPNLKYSDLRNYLAEKNIDQPTLADIRAAVTSIRDKKFTFPTKPENGNAGSFFKNLVLSESQYKILEDNVRRNFEATTLEGLQKLKNKFPDPRGIKIPTAFLIEVCGLKGTQVGGVKINPPQPLVILNVTGKATAIDVLKLFKQVRQTIFEKTGMEVTNEPELVGFDSRELAGFYEL